MDKNCKNCTYFQELVINPEYGECHCVSSKYYGDIINGNETCEQIFLKEKK